MHTINGDDESCWIIIALSFWRISSTKTPKRKKKQISEWFGCCALSLSTYKRFIAELFQPHLSNYFCLSYWSELTFSRLITNKFIYLYFINISFLLYFFFHAAIITLFVSFLLLVSFLAGAAVGCIQQQHVFVYFCTTRNSLIKTCILCRCIFGALILNTACIFYIVLGFVA